MAMNASDIRASSQEGNSNWEVLHQVVESGVEFPDAVWAVTKALGLPKTEVEQMKADYDDCI